MSAPANLNKFRPLTSRNARREVLHLVLELSAVTRATVDAVEGRGPIAYESPEYDKLVDRSVDLQCDILSWVEWDNATPEERKAKAEEAMRKEQAQCES